jgi:hypothetical protein
MFRQKEDHARDQRLFSWSRIKTLIIGTVLAMIAGLVVVNTFTYFQYGGTMFDRYFERKAKSPMAGKLAFDKGTKYYIGVIRGEGHISSRGDVYFIEQAGGNIVDVAKQNVEVREPGENR